MGQPEILYGFRSRKTSVGSELSQGNEKAEKVKHLLKLVSISDESNIGIDDVEDGNVDDVCDDKLMTVDL